MEKDERMTKPISNESGMSETKLVPPQGMRFPIQICPECGVLNLSPLAPWHSMDCSEPDMEEWIAQVAGRA
jgi:acetone carboxylase gamma subunit